MSENTDPAGVHEDSRLSAYEFLLVALIGLALLSFLLVGAGTLVLELSKLAAVPLPLAENDPESVEVLGLLQLAAYGLGSAVVVTCALVLGLRLAPARLRPRLQEAAIRIVGGGLLGLVSAGGVLIGVDERDPAILLLAAGFAYSAVRVVLDLPLDDEDD